MTSHDIKGMNPREIESLIDSVYPEISSAFKGTVTDMYNLFARKTLDYGIQNMKAGAAALDNPEDIHFSLLGIWFRIMDKVNRWKNLLTSGRFDAVNEPLFDTLQDIAVYAVLAQIIYKGQWIDPKQSYEESTKESTRDSGVAEGTGQRS